MKSTKNKNILGRKKKNNSADDYQTYLNYNENRWWVINIEKCWLLMIDDCLVGTF